MSPAPGSSFDDELARARLAFISAGQPALGAPRRAASEADELEPAARDAPVAVEMVREAVQHNAASRFLGRFTLTARQAVAIVVVLLCGVGVTLTALGQSSASQVPVVTELAQSTAPASSAPSPSPTPSLLRVHVMGAVSSPGVVTVSEGAIVQDAVLAAGGLRADADPAELNFAASLIGGQQVIVGTTTEPRGEVVQQQGSAEDRTAGTLLNLNTATAAELEALPGVGPVTASAIVEWRETNDGFHSVADLQEVTGIGPKSFAKLEPLVTT